MNLFSGRGQIKILKYHQTRAHLPFPSPTALPSCRQRSTPRIESVLVATRNSVQILRQNWNIKLVVGRGGTDATLTCC